MPDELEPECKDEADDQRCAIIGGAINYLREHKIDARLSRFYGSRVSYIIALYDLPENLFEETENGKA